ncbi:hypothetical protein MTR67_030416 [Solanum verrucosum]|uniref:Uncharacterized protein n=1 Tax=Solanum verrucosum TaxID=315347 RepID=A0AAF0RDX1_SOLVR|nr:hypothetical protein MTR67_030416 [Solanum verrucosum]
MLTGGKASYTPFNEVPNMEILKTMLGCEVGALSTIYLGLPLGAKSMSMEIWNGVIEKCEKKLARWKSQYLSMGGRLTLINYVLDALPTYMMSLFPIPPGIINRLDSIRRKFLWQGNKDRVLKAKYEENDNWMIKEVTTPYGVSLWKSIRILWNEFKVNTIVKVADGVKTVIWKDD